MATKWDTRIIALLTRGYSVDLLSELGVGRWSRADIQRIVAEHGWALDFGGRLQPQHQKEAAFDAVPLKHPAVEEECADRLIEVGLDHRNAHIQNQARKAQEAVEALRTELLLREEVAAGLSARWTRSNRPPGVVTPESRDLGSEGSTGQGMGICV